jgi:hypothetical protein
MNTPVKLTLGQFCERTGMNPVVAARGFKEGKLPGYQIGARHYEIWITWVEQWERGEPGFWSPTGSHPTMASVTTPYLRYMA